MNDHASHKATDGYGAYVAVVRGCLIASVIARGSNRVLLEPSVEVASGKANETPTEADVRNTALGNKSVKRAQLQVQMRRRLFVRK
jgi:hypothetical protein